MADTKSPSKLGPGLLAVLWVLAVLCALAAVLIFCFQPGTVETSVQWHRAMLVLLCFCAMLILVAVGAGSVLAVNHLRRQRVGIDSMVNDLRRMLSGQTQMQATLTQISQNLLLSDAIKSVAFREKARSTLQEAIRQDIRREQWGSAEVLISELATRFGAQSEAEALRREMEQYRQATIQEKIEQSIRHIQSLWSIHRYEDAEREVETLLAIYPNETSVQELRGKTQAHWDTHKKELLARWNKAVESNDVEQGVELLKLMDKYLSPTEAAALEESARGVFRAKLHNLGVKFSLFVTEKRWMQALQIGREIIKEYPNSRMAQEVRERLNILEQRARE